MYRCLEDNLVPRVGQPFNQRLERRIDRHGIGNPLFFNLELAVAFEVTYDCLVIVLPLIGIAKMPVIDYLLKCLQDRRRCLEIHLRSSKTQQVGIALAVLLILPFHGVKF